MEGHSELCLQSLFINVLDKMKDMIALAYVIKEAVRAAVVHLNFRGGSAFPVPVCTVPSPLDTSLAGATRLTRSDFKLQIGRIYFY